MRDGKTKTHKSRAERLDKAVLPLLHPLRLVKSNPLEAGQTELVKQIFSLPLKPCDSGILRAKRGRPVGAPVLATSKQGSAPHRGSGLSCSGFHGRLENPPDWMLQEAAGD